MKLQEDLKATLRPSDTKPEVVLALQDMLIARVEGWVDSVEDLQVLTGMDIDILRQALAANRRVYRMKALAMHQVEISADERNAAYSGERDRSFRSIVTAAHELMLRG